jgi:hypothetical protein
LSVDLFVLLLTLCWLIISNSIIKFETNTTKNIIDGIVYIFLSIKIFMDIIYSYIKDKENKQNNENLLTK